MRVAVKIENEHQWDTVQVIEVHKGCEWNNNETHIDYDTSYTYILLSYEGIGIQRGSNNESDYDTITFDAYMASNFNPATDDDGEIEVATTNETQWFAVQLIEKARGLKWAGGQRSIDYADESTSFLQIRDVLRYGASASISNVVSFKDYLNFRLTNNPIKRKTPYDSVLPGNAENWQMVEDIERLKGRMWASGSPRLVFQGTDRCIGLDQGGMLQGRSYKKTMSMKQYLNYNKAYIKQLEEIEASKPTMGTPERAIFDVQDVFPEHLRLSKDLQIKPVVFDLKNELSSDYLIGDMVVKIANMLHDMIKGDCPLLNVIPLTHTRNKLRDKLYHALSAALTTDFFQNYYTEGGAKITKRLKGIVKGVIGKELTDKIFPVFCNKLSACYAKQETIVAFFGDKENLGEGLFENGATCFRRKNGGRGENAINGDFLDKNKRFQMLCLYSLEQQAFARVVVHFVGGRKVDIFNFYYQGGFKQNKRLFVEAYRRLFNLKKVTFVSGKTIEVPIYYNDDSLVISTDRTHTSTHKHKWVCPHCDSKAEPKTFQTRQRDYWRDLGCKESCLTLTSSERCYSCEDSFDRDDMQENYDGDLYCRSCYNEFYFRCTNCGDEARNDNAIGTSGGYCCTDCAGYCNDCGDGELNINLTDEGLCSDCHIEHFGICEECEGEYPRDELNADGLCNHCESKLEEMEEENEATA